MLGRLAPEQPYDERRLLMVDPSLLLSGEGLAWLREEPLARRGVIVPATFRRWLVDEVDLDLTRIVAPDDAEQLTERHDLLRELLGDFPDFSHRERRLQRGAEDVRRALLSGSDPNRELWADEWVFLQSHSVLVAKLRSALDAFRDAGGAILEVGRREGMELIRNVIRPEHIPPALTPQLIARATAKWVVVGGAGIGGGTLGGLLGTSVGGPVGGVIGAGAGRLMGRKAAGAAVLAIDP
jgi:hypothetical protein